MSKETFEETISIEINDKTYTGRRIITGKRVQYQTIHYAGKEKDDSTRYTVERQHRMEVMAKIILNELVKECHNLAPYR